MASSEKSLSFFFFLMLFSSLQIEASSRFFFSKASGSKNNYNAEDANNIPLSYEQQAKPLPEVAAPTKAPRVVVDQPKEPSFTRNQYGGYGLFGSTEGTSANTDTSSNNEKNNNNEDNFIYNLENDFNGNSKDNIWDEIKQQGLTQSLEDGRYNVDLDNENKNRFNGYDPVRRGSTGNEDYDGESEKQNEFDSLEEFEKYLQRLGYLP